MKLQLNVKLIFIFWLIHILVYLFYFCSSLCPSSDRSIINKQGYGLDRKGTWKRGNWWVT